MSTHQKFKIIKIIITVLVVSQTSLCANPLSDFFTGLHPGVSLGSGPYCGLSGVALESYFYINGEHNLSLHGGIGTHEYESPVYGAGLRYGYGREDRLIIDAAYLCVETYEEETWQYELIEETDGEKYWTIVDYDIESVVEYRPALLIGYQRMFSNNISLVAAIGLAYYSGAMPFFSNESEIPLATVYNISVGVHL